MFTVTGGEFTVYYRFLKGLYGLADIPTIFQKRLHKTLEFYYAAWLDDIIIVTKGNIEEHETEGKRNSEEIRRGRVQTTLEEMQILHKRS